MVLGFPFHRINDTLPHTKDHPLMSSITADATTLMRQAHLAANDYLNNSIKWIDTRLGKGYAKDHPELIGAYMQTCAVDLGAAIMAKEISNAIEEAAYSLRDRLNGLSEDIRSDHSLQGFDGIVDALQAIAASYRHS